MTKRAIWVMLSIGIASITPAIAAESTKGAAQQACKADAERLCASVKRGEGRVAKCLSENNDQLSAQCKDAMQRASSRQKRGETKSS